MDAELIHLLPSGAGWTILAIFLILVFGPMSIFSRESAKKLWLIGRLVSWFQERRRRAIDAEAEVEKVRAAYIQDQVTSLRLAMDNDRRWYAGEIDTLRKDLAAEREARRESENRLKKVIDQWQEYADYTAAWARNVLEKHRLYGWKPPLEPQKSFAEWSETSGQRSE